MQWPLVALGSNHQQSVAISGNQWPLVALGSNHRQSRLLSHLPQVTRGGGANNGEAATELMASRPQLAIEGSRGQP